MSESSKSKKSRPKRQKDTNQLAAEIVGLSTKDEAEGDPVKAYLSEIGKKGGLKGGAARAKKLSKRRRMEIASRAATARWGKPHEEKK